MDWLNYHHFLYFWVVAKEGSIARASKRLNLTHSTISGQIHSLEDTLGVKLFRRKGRGLALTDDGQVAFRYADKIFLLGTEYLDVVKGRSSGQMNLRLSVGVSEVVPKSLVRRILEPVFLMDRPTVVACSTDRSMDAFLSELVDGQLDALISDGVAAGPVRTFSHPLGGCGSVFVASDRTLKACGAGAPFPKLLDGAPVVFPARNTTLRRAVDEWLASRDLQPTLVMELDDMALGCELAASDVGIIVIPSVIEAEVRDRYGLQVVGIAGDLVQSFYVISLSERYDIRQLMRCATMPVSVSSSGHWALSATRR